ncbi:hypothetical protein ABZY19_09805 [Streptomyces sp. NPDC006475]|uniref:hypothetical protein n=1 Tax=Streptomyces sp. NPDC006475 TaxID=3155719 RepID=UPI0033A9A769
MISEPELVGDEEGFGEPEIPGQRKDDAGDREATAETVSAADAPWFRRPPPQAWLWALGGAVTASAVWAAGLYVHESRGPDMGAYRESGNLCLDTEVKALSTALGEVDSPRPSGREHAARDMATCWIHLVDSTAKEADQYTPTTVFVTYALHKKTDPGPEFDAGVGTDMFFGDTEIAMERVEGLGERAYFVLSGGSGTPGLHVLDGQAVLTMTVSPGALSGSDTDVDPADASEIRPFMAEDMRALMAELQS